MDKIEFYKKKYEKKTSEELFYIDKQPGDTCPMIDDVISSINYILSQCDRFESKNDYDLYFIKDDLKGLENNLEEIRENVKKIRSWGKEWKQTTKKIINKDLKIEDLI